MDVESDGEDEGGERKQRQRKRGADTTVQDMDEDSGGEEEPQQQRAPAQTGAQPTGARPPLPSAPPPKDRMQPPLPPTPDNVIVKDYNPKGADSTASIVQLCTMSIR